MSVKYPFPVTDYTPTDEIYNSIKEKDRVVFLSRHAERGWDYGINGGLVENGVKQAKSLGEKLQGGRFSDTSNDFYGSTGFKRTVETSFYLGQTRGCQKFLGKEFPEDWQNYKDIFHPINTVNYDYFGYDAENRYSTHKETGDEKAISMVEDLISLTEGHDFSWITTHDVVIVPFLSWLSRGELKYTKETWINYLSGVAIIVKEDGGYEIYPIRTLKENTMVLLD